ncbi:MAG: HEPN domain-containing protein [Myxococcota bacterium]
MTTVDLARAYLDQARIRLDLLAELRRRGAWNDVVRFAQEAVELALKALLRHAAIDPPKAHDVGPALLGAASRLPPAAAARCAEFARISTALAASRGPAFYGNEAAGVPASQLFGTAEADNAEQLARKVVEGVTTIMSAP